MSLHSLMFSQNSHFRAMFPLDSQDEPRDPVHDTAEAIAAACYLHGHSQVSLWICSMRLDGLTAELRDLQAEGRYGGDPDAVACAARVNCARRLVKRAIAGIEARLS